MLITYTQTEQNYIKATTCNTMVHTYLRKHVRALTHTHTHTDARVHTHMHTCTHACTHTHHTYFHSQSRANQFTDCTKLVAMKVNCHQQQHLTKRCSNTTRTTIRIYKQKLQYMRHNWQQIQIPCRNLTDFRVT
jgi:hypothetical protein